MIGCDVEKSVEVEDVEKVRKMQRTYEERVKR